MTPSYVVRASVSWRRKRDALSRSAIKSRRPLPVGCGRGMSRDLAAEKLTKACARLALGAPAFREGFDTASATCHGYGLLALNDLPEAASKPLIRSACCRVEAPFRDGRR